MKNLPVVVGLALAIAVMGCSRGTQPAAAQNNANTIKFDKTLHDFGDIAFGSDGIFEFVFTNTGNEPLVLSNVRSSCGCTIPEWPKEPVNAGEKSKIKVHYNTKLVGRFTKKISVYCSGSETPVVLTIKGNVLAADSE